MNRSGVREVLSSLGLEGAQLGAAQHRWPDLAVYAAVILAVEAGRDPRAAVLSLVKAAPEFMGRRKLYAIIEAAHRFEVL